MSVAQERPVVTADVYTPLALGYVPQYGHLWYRSMTPHRAGERRGPQVRLDNCETIPDLRVTTILPQAPAAYDDASILNWQGDTSYFSDAPCDHYPERWLVCEEANAAAPARVITKKTCHYLEPGILVRYRLSAPTIDATVAPMLGIGLCGSTTASKPILEVRFPRAHNASSDGQEVPRPRIVRWPTNVAAWQAGQTYPVGYVVSLSGAYYGCICANTGQSPPNASYWELFDPNNPPPVAEYHGGWTAEHSGLTVVRIRALMGYLLVWGPGMGEPWAVRLPKGLSLPSAIYTRLRLAGGPGAIHVQQLSYQGNGVVSELEGPATPSHCTVAASAGCTVYPGDGGYVTTTAYPLRATMHSANGGMASPRLYTVTCLHSPTVTGPTGEEPLATVAPTKATWHLTREGRGQRAELTFPRGTDLSGVARDAVVAINGNWWGDVDPHAQFTGRVDSVRTGKTELMLDYPTIALIDDGDLLDRTYCTTATGNWSGQTLTYAVTALLGEAGFDSTRIDLTGLTTGATQPLRPADPASLQFGKQTSLRSALDTLAFAAGCEWYIDAWGNAIFVWPTGTWNPPPTSFALSLDPSISTFLGFIDRATHEESHGGEYFNAVWVEDSRTGNYLVKAVPWTKDLLTRWKVDVGEYDNLAWRANTLIARYRAEGSKVSWREILDPANPIRPRDWRIAAATCAEIGLTTGQRLQVQEVTNHFDQEAPAGQRLVAEIVATIYTDPETGT